MITVVYSFSDGRTERTHRMPFVPRLGDHVILEAKEYEVARVWWDLVKPEKVVVRLV